LTFFPKTLISHSFTNLTDSENCLNTGRAREIEEERGRKRRLQVRVVNVRPNVNRLGAKVGQG